MKQKEENVRDDFAVSSALYVLKHKDLDVAMVQIDARSGKIEYILEVYLPKEVPVGCSADGGGLIEWWEMRAIPDSRRGIQQVLGRLGEESSLSLMLSAYGLSLTDHYWVQPVGEELYWKDLNFYENEFSDELGSMLTESEKIDMDEYISKFSPSSSVNGEMKKKWVIKEGIRYLMKVNVSDYGQQSVNEVIACRMHKSLGWQNYVPYGIERVHLEGKEVPCSLNPLFTSEELEFIPAYQLIKNYKVPNEVSVYESLIGQAAMLGINASTVRRQLEYTIMTDFIITNTDRHFNNFGFLYDPVRHEIVGMAPIFDTGNALFYDKEVIPDKSNLLDIAVRSFSRKEVRMLRYVRQRDMVDLERLSDFPLEVEEMLVSYTEMPQSRAKSIARTVEQKIEYLALFQQGKKIWKQEKYW